MYNIQSRIGKNSEIIKCSICKTSTLSDDTVYYYCCEPVKVCKLVCGNCQAKKKCNKCKYKKAFYQIKLSDIDKMFQVQQIQRNNNQNNNNHTANRQCIMCRRNFSQQKIQSINHKSCESYFCYPCYYKVYKNQNQMFDQVQDIQSKTKYKILMPCCLNQGQSIWDAQELFIRGVCIFCGISQDVKNISGKNLVKIQDKICFCVECRANHLSKIQKIMPTSVIQVLQFIIHQFLKQCYFCEQKIGIQKLNYMENQQIIATNSNLCLKCFQKNSFSNKINKNSLKYFKSIRISQSDKQSQNIKKKCSKCKQTWTKQIDLFEWKDSKLYCNMCLYQKYQEKRKSFKKKMNQSKLSQNEDNFICQLRSCFQMHFQCSCAVCGVDFVTKKILTEKFNEQTTKKTKNQQSQIIFELCYTCLNIMIMNPNKYQMLLKFRIQIINQRPQIQKFLIDLKIKNQTKTEELVHNNNMNQNEIQKVQKQSKPGHFKKFFSKIMKSQIDKQKDDKKNNQQNSIQKQHHQTNSIPSDPVDHNNTPQNDQFVDCQQLDQIQFDKKLNLTKPLQTQSEIKNQLIQPNSQLMRRINLIKQPITIQMYQKLQSQQKEVMRQIYQEFKSQQKRDVLVQIDTELEEKQQVNKKTFAGKYQKNDVRYWQQKRQRQKQECVNLQQVDIQMEAYQKQYRCKIFICQNSCRQGQHLMMGIMCKQCFVKYLLGMIDLTKQLDDYEQFKQNWQKQQQSLNVYQQSV